MNARILFIAGILLSLLAGCNQQSPAGGTYVWLDAPVGGLSFAELRTILIEGHASAPGGIQRVEISVNGDLLTTINEPKLEGNLASYQTAWSPTEPGDYLIQVIAYDSGGFASEPDTVVIQFGGESPVEAPIVEEIPVTETPTGTPTVETMIDPTFTPTATPSPTPTNTATPSAVIQFWAEPNSIQAGSCTTLNWHVENVRQVIFGGVNQPFTGSDQECLCSDQEYSLRVVHLDKREEILTLEVTVSGTCPTPTVKDTTPPDMPVQVVPADGLSLTCRSSQDLTWLPVSDASGILYYQVEIQKSSDNSVWQAMPGIPIRVEGAKTVSVDVECGWYYRWKVRAIDGQGNIGAYSAWWYFSIRLD